MMKHRIPQTAAALVAVVFLLLLGGCSWMENASEGSVGSADEALAAKPGETFAGRKTQKRRRAWEYSRIPHNAPADWQQSRIGN